MAVRDKTYKMHFYTRPGYSGTPPISPNPPLLFNLDNDPGELYPLDATEYQEVINDLTAAAEAHKSQMFFAPSQYEIDAGFPVPGQSYQVIPCCQGQNNMSKTPRVKKSKKG